MTAQPFTAPSSSSHAGPREAVSVPYSQSFSIPWSLPANIRLVQTTTTGAIDILKVLSAFAAGADGVMVIWAGRATERQQQRAQVLRELLHFIGCSRERLAIVEGAPDAQMQREFAARIQMLGPWMLGDGSHLAAELAELPLHGVAAHAPVATSQALRRVATALLAAGKVEGVLAWGQAANEIRPVLARTPEQAQRLFAGGRGYPNLTTLLGRVAKQNVAIVVRPVELACIKALTEDGFPIPSSLFLIGQGVAASEASECDAVLPAADADSAGESSGNELAAIEQWPLADRAAYWGAQFSNCVRCDGCRSACPFRCYSDCVGDSLIPNSKRAPTTSQIACAHLACAVRLAGHCVQCESCSSACPQSVPLYLLHQKASQVLARLG